MRLAALLPRRRLPPGVEMHPEAHVARDVRFDVAPGARLILERGCRIGGGTRFDVASGEVTVGADALLGRRCVVQARDRITIGHGVRTGDFVMLTDALPPEDDADVEQPLRHVGRRSAPVEIGEGAMLGAGACVQGGVRVGAGAVLEAGSLAAREVPAGATHVGVPAGPPSRPRARRGRRRLGGRDSTER